MAMSRSREASELKIFPALAAWGLPANGEADLATVGTSEFEWLNSRFGSGVYVHAVFGISQDGKLMGMGGVPEESGVAIFIGGIQTGERAKARGCTSTIPGNP